MSNTNNISNVTYEELNSLLEKGFRWLSSKISKTSLLLSGRTIGLALISYCIYDYQKNRRKIGALKKRLLSLQKDDGSWNNELWDTAWGIRAIAIERLSSGKTAVNFAYPPLRSALTYIEDTKNVRNNWQGEWYESIVTALSLLQMNYSKEYPFIKKSVEWVIERQNREGFWIDIYDTCLATRLLVEAQDQFKEDYSHVISSAIAWLRKWEPHAENVWTNANLLMCFLEACRPDDQSIARIYRWFVENESDGCWSSYEDEQAYSLIALANLRNRIFLEATAKKETPAHERVGRVLQQFVEINQHNIANSVIENCLRSFRGNVIGMLDYVDETTFNFLDFIPKTCSIRLIVSRIQGSKTQMQKKAANLGKGVKQLEIKKIDALVTGEKFGGKIHHRWLACDGSTTLEKLPCNGLVVDFGTDLKSGSIANTEHKIEAFTNPDEEKKEFEKYWHRTEEEWTEFTGKQFSVQTFYSNISHTNP